MAKLAKDVELDRMGIVVWQIKSWAFGLVFAGDLGALGVGRGQRLVVVVIDGIGGWAAVVVVSPDTVPDGCDEHETEKHNRGIVHTFLGDHLESGHAEEGNGEDTPC